MAAELHRPSELTYSLTVSILIYVISEPSWRWQRSSTLAARLLG